MTQAQFRNKLMVVIENNYNRIMEGRVTCFSLLHYILVDLTKNFHIPHMDMHNRRNMRLAKNIRKVCERAWEERLTLADTYMLFVETTGVDLE